jgi:hypothetical protein
VRFYLTVCAMYSNVDGMQFKQIKSELQITWLHLSLKEETSIKTMHELSNLTQLNEQDHQITKWHCGGSAQWIYVYKFTTIGKLSQNTIYDWN